MTKKQVPLRGLVNNIHFKLFFEGIEMMLMKEFTKGGKEI
jgi:hypothetical protein